jgi:ribose transport system substrate-binding protein
MKRIALICAIALFAFTAIMATASGAGESGAKRPTVVLLMLGMESPYCPPYVSNFTEIVNKANMNMFMFNAKFDAKLQASQMDDAIAMKPAVIAVFAADSQGIAPGVKKAYDAGIPVLMINNAPVKESYPYIVGFGGPNAYQEGEAVAEMMNDLLKGKGNVVLVEGLAGQANQIDRAQGFIDKSAKIGAHFNILARQAANWRKDLAVQVMADFITRYKGQIDAVYAEDDTLGVGASIAMTEASIPNGSIPIFGVGGSKEGLKAIDEGTMYGTVMQSPIVETNLVAQMAVDIVKNGVKAGQHLEPFLKYMDLPKVTKANVSKYLPGDW